jgi:glutamate---cysteine ligase / carboxylate-amine ligase
MLFRSDGSPNPSQSADHRLGSELPRGGVSAHPGHPEWAEWHTSRPYTVGIEEEVMLLDPECWGLAHESEQVLAELPPDFGAHAAAETHQATIELATSPWETALETAREGRELRVGLCHELEKWNLRVASAGTHPFALWSDTRVSRSARYQLVYESMRELARREPTFALHVHIGVGDPERAIVLQNRLRAHLPLLLALSANSPFWQARNTGLASSRTPIFQAFPRVGVPRMFRSYGEYVEAVDQLLRVDAFPAPTFLWWDVRPQPRFGTVEVRVMDAQTTAANTAVLAGTIQAIAHLELEEGYAADQVIAAEEVLQENRFLAARDGMKARFIDPVVERRVSAHDVLADLLVAVRAHAEDLGCEALLDQLRDMALQNGAEEQVAIARQSGLPGVVRALAARFAEPAP